MSTEPAHTSFAKANFTKSGESRGMQGRYCKLTTTPHHAGSSGLYDRARPDYPLEAIETILSQTQPGAHVIELGAGTGLFTRGFLKAASNSAGRIAKLTAVEPSEGMRQGFAAKVPKQTDIQVECVDGLFDKIPAPDASADLVRWRPESPPPEIIC